MSFWTEKEREEEKFWDQMHPMTESREEEAFEGDGYEIVLGCAIYPRIDYKVKAMTMQQLRKGIRNLKSSYGDVIIDSIDKNQIDDSYTAYMFKVSS